MKYVDTKLDAVVKGCEKRIVSTSHDSKHPDTGTRLEIKPNT